MSIDGVGRRIVVGGVLLRREQDERVRAHHFFERLDRLLAADEQRNDHVRENDDVPQRQHRIGPAFAGCQERLGFGGACHGPTSLLLCTPSRPADALSRRTAGGREGNREALGRYEPPGSTRFSYAFSFDTIGGVAPRACQERPVFRAKRRVAKAERMAAHRIAGAGCPRHPSGARSAGLAGAIGPVGIDVERPGACPRRPRARSRPPRRLPGSADRTWCRAGCSP